MHYMLREIPNKERPRERLKQAGAIALSDQELLAILLRTGVKDISVLDVARELTLRYDGLHALNEATLTELEQIKGIGSAKAITLLAAVELGKRIATYLPPKQTLESPLATYHYLKQKITNIHQETLFCLFLNIRNQVIAEKIISIGTLDHTIIHPRDILKWALKHSAYGIIIAHNHPSGNPNPSQMDSQVTNQIMQAAKTIGLVVIDHIIIGHQSYYSFAKKNTQRIT